MSDPIEILSQLFGTLKDASNRNEKATQKLIDQQMELVGHIKAMPIEDIRKALSEHVTESRNGIADIAAKVTKIFIIVGVTITVATSGYFLIRHSAEKQSKLTWKQELELIEHQQEEAMDKKLEIMMEEIRKEMRRLHKEDEHIDDTSLEGNLP